MSVYETIPAFARKDLLTAAKYNKLRANGRYVQETFRAEHLEATGEHNSPNIARTLGTVLCAAGPAYSLAGFNTDASLATGFNPRVGRAIITLPAGRYISDGAALMVQNAGINGDLGPRLSYAVWTSDRTVGVHSVNWTGTLGVAGSGAWNAGEDASFHIGIHGPALDGGTLAGFGGAVTGANGLRAGSTSTGYNEFVQSTANLQVAMDVGHTNGAHDCREVAKAWAHVQWDGSKFGIVSQSAGKYFDGAAFSSIDAVSSGVVEVSFLAPMNATYQAFVDVDYARSASGATSDYFIACTPSDERNTRSFRMYLYKRLLTGPGVEYFDRSSAVDFYLWLFHDH